MQRPPCWRACKTVAAQGENIDLQWVKDGGHGGYYTLVQEELSNVSSWIRKVVGAKPSGTPCSTGSEGSAFSNKEGESQPCLEACLFLSFLFLSLLGYLELFGQLFGFFSLYSSDFIQLQLFSLLCLVQLPFFQFLLLLFLNPLFPCYYVL